MHVEHIDDVTTKNTHSAEGIGFSRDPLEGSSRSTDVASLSVL
jgi:hypothetical protein